MFEVKSLSFDELPADRKDNVSNNGSGSEYAEYLAVYNDGKLIRLESDAMEPEDAMFCRDLGWVFDAIDEAYEIGKTE